MREDIYIKIDKLLLILAGFFLIRPDYFQSVSQIGAIWIHGEFLLWVVVGYLVYENLELKNAGIVLGLSIFIWLGISTYLNNGSFSVYYYEALRPITALLITYYGIRYKEIDFLKSFGLFFIGYTLVNLISMFLFPHGLSVENTGFSNGAEISFFLGKNTAIKITDLALFFLMCYQIRAKKGINNWTKIFAGIVFFQAVFSGSGTSKIATGLILLVLLIGIEKTPKIINLFTGLIVNILFFFGIIVLELQYVFEDLIVGVLQKDLTFTGRTPLWRMGLFWIINNWKIGYGVEEKTVAAAKIGVRNDSMHNFIIDWTYQGGVIVILLWIVWVIYLGFQVRKIENLELRNAINLCSFAMMIIWMTEPFSRSRIVTTVILFAMISTYSAMKKVDE